MKVRWSDLAKADLEGARDYIARERSSAARRIARRIVATSRFLARYPHLGRSGSLAETRELPVAGTPYILIYRMTMSDVEILRVLHGAQDWPPHS